MPPVRSDFMALVSETNGVTAGRPLNDFLMLQRSRAGGLIKMRECVSFWFFGQFVRARSTPIASPSDTAMDLYIIFCIDPEGTWM